MTHDELQQLRDLLARALTRGRWAMLATLVARDGHSYREVGDMMAADETLAAVGGVSGGCVEPYLVRVGRELLADRESVLLSFDTAADVPDRPVLGCGGRLEILLERAAAHHVAFLDRLLASADHDDLAWLIRYDESGARLPRGFLDTSSPDEAEFLRESIDLREPLVRTSNATAVYAWPRPRLVIFGARDDAQPLAQMARLASWHVSVFDRRARLATGERFPWAEVVRDGPWDACVSTATWTPHTAAVLMTHSVEDDADILPLLAERELFYLGVLGPSSRSQKLRDGLPVAVRERMRSPVGVPLGEKSPAAVAVSILAELIATRRGRRVAPVT